MSGEEHQVDGRALRHQHRRPELLAAAVEYILDHGIGELSLRPMAKELGVTHATLLRHFGSKEQLVTEVVDHIRAGLFTAPPPQRRTPATQAESMWAVWCRLCEPSERRQFALLFELVAVEARDPGRFSSVAPVLVTDFLVPLEASMRNLGMSRRVARDVATGYLAHVRGLQLDLAVTGDRRRVDAAMKHYINTVTRLDS